MRRPERAAAHLVERRDRRERRARAAADDAVAKADAFGLPSGSPIYFDMEGYKVNDAACTKSVQSFVTAWTTELHALGYVSGVYGSAASTIRDVAALGTGLPDAGWIANWNGVEGVFGDPYVSDAVWTNHQRVHQYKGGHKETWAGVTINIDSDYVDGPVVGGSAHRRRRRRRRAARRLGRLGRLEGDRDLAERRVQLDVGRHADADDPGARAERLRSATHGHRHADGDAGDALRERPSMSICLSRLPGSLRRGRSTARPGSRCRTSPQPSLPAGVDAGYILDPDGTVEILTLVPGFFGLLPDTVPPTQPQAFRGQFVKGAPAARLASVDRQQRHHRLVPGAARRNGGVEPAREVSPRHRTRIPLGRSDGLPGASRRRLRRARQTVAPDRRRADETPGRHAEGPAPLGVGAARLPAASGAAPGEGPEEAAGVVLALGGVAPRPVPPQALSSAAATAAWP